MPVRRPWAYERGTLWAIELDSRPAQPLSPHVAITFGEVGPASLAPLVAAMGQSDASVVQRRFNAGRRCFAASVEAQIVAYGWVSRGEECIGELERAFRMRAGETYIWDCATLRQFRRQGLYVALLRHIVASLRVEGVRRIWIGASLQNHPSIRGFASAGFRPVLTLTYLRLLGLAQLWMRGDPTVPPRLVADARWSLGVGHEPTPRDEMPSEAQLARIVACPEENAP
jgi:ribosomal protein S18 acetylase RimI-like enzyme